jgi:molecular chaperone GrpE
MKKSKSPDQSAETAADRQADQADAPAIATGEAAGQQNRNTEIITGDPASDIDPVLTLQAELAARDNDFEVLSDKYLRLAAEYDNFRRRSQLERKALYSENIALVIKELLPVLDNLDRAGLSAAQYHHADARKIAEGVAMIQKQVDQALTRLGVSKIECVGQTFNPDLHEAVMHVEDDSVGASVVIAELQPGYIRDDRVIRHSMVKVAN